MRLVNHLHILHLFCAMLSGLVTWAQSDIEGLVVETYYVSDANDATDTDGGSLITGSVTYRVFLDLAPGVKLRGFYANVNHPFVISSTTGFFNNEDRGEPYGFDIPSNRIDENTVALDSWLSFGKSSTEHWAVEKLADTDGSLVGGASSDGGSEAIPGGILVHQAPEAGIPLTQSDGLIAYSGQAQTNVIQTGDLLSTVFGEVNSPGPFSSTSFAFLNDGVLGQTTDNKILIAQLTTTGELSFSINVRLIREDGTPISYVADGTVLEPGEAVSSYLTYPPQCGCTDPDYLEYNAAAGCDDGSCSTIVILGCNDPSACNYDPAVNLNVQELCCILPDNCVGLDVDLICPGAVSITEQIEEALSIYPNPTAGALHIASLPEGQSLRRITVYTLSGQIIHEEALPEAGPTGTYTLHLKGMDTGSYILRLSGEAMEYHQPILFVH